MGRRSADHAGTAIAERAGTTGAGSLCVNQRRGGDERRRQRDGR